MTKFSSIFCQLLQLFSRLDFQQAVKGIKASDMPEGLPAGPNL
jgi:hypothetical protein